MSNHNTAGSTFFLKLVYTNDVVTYIPLIGLSYRYVASMLKEKLLKI